MEDMGKMEDVGDGGDQGYLVTLQLPGSSTWQPHCLLEVPAHPAQDHQGGTPQLCQGGQQAQVWHTGGYTC